MKIAILLLMTLIISCQKQSSNEKGQDFKTFIENSVDSDNDGLNDYEEMFIQSDPQIAQIPLFEFKMDSPSELGIEVFSEDNSYSTLNLSLELGTELKPLIYEKAVKNVYNAFYNDLKELDKMSIKDLYTYNLGCISEKDQKSLIQKESFGLDKALLKTELTIIPMVQKSMDKFDELDFSLNLGSESLISHLFLDTLVSKFNLSIDKIITSSYINLPYHKLGTKLLSQNSTCLLSKLNNLKYKWGPKKLDINEITNQIDKNNATFIYINEDDKRVISLKDQMSIRDSLKTINMLNIVTSNKINVVDNFDKNVAIDKRWYFLGGGKNFLNEKSQRKIYILAKLSKTDFKKYAKNITTKEFNLKASKNTILNNIAFDDTIKITTKFFRRLHIPTDESVAITGEFFNSCSVRILGNIQVCKPRWEVSKGACIKNVTYSSKELSNWHHVDESQLPFNSKSLFINNKKWLAPSFNFAGEFFFEFSPRKLDLDSSRLEINMASSILNESNQPITHAINKSITYHARKEGFRCKGVQNSSETIYVDGELQADFKIIHKKW